MGLVLWSGSVSVELMHEGGDVIGPHFGAGHGKMTNGGGRSGLHDVAAMGNLGRQALQDAKLIGIELVIAKVEREDLRLDPAKRWLGVIIS